MPNPWLAIPLGEYEGHMRSERVRQLEALSELFGRVLEQRRPESVAILGVAGGNGLERIDPSITKRVVGFDINAAYLDAAARRHGNLTGLEFHCLDLSCERVRVEPVQLVHAAMVFEHAGVGRCFENAIAMTTRDLSVVLQLPSESEPGVAVTAYPSIETLRDHFTLIEPGRLGGMLQRRGFSLLAEERCPLPSGKAFWMGTFTASGGR